MTTYELISVLILFLTFLTVAVGLIYAGLQLKRASEQIAQTRKVHQDNHEWNRRLASQEALRAYNYSLLSSPLQEVFNYLNASEAIPLANINSEFEKNKDLQPDLHQLLNYYEGLARGIHQSLFDEEVIKAARKNAMIMAETGFSNYIKNRRESVNPYAWKELSSVISKWQNDDQHIPARLKTGG